MTQSIEKPIGTAGGGAPCCVFNNQRRSNDDTESSDRSSVKARDGRGVHEGDPRTGRAIGQREGSMSVASPLPSRRFLASAPSANL